MKKILFLLVGVLTMALANATTYTTTSGSSSISSDHSTWSENNVTWKLAYTWLSGSGYFATENDGLHIGSSSNGIGTIKMSTGDIPGKIKSVTINCKSNGSTSLAVTVGNTSFTYNGNESVTITNSSSSYAFIGESTGEIVIDFNNSTNKKNIYIKEVVVEYEEVTEDPTSVGDIKLFNGDTEIDPTEGVNIPEGTVLTISSDKATSIMVGETSLNVTDNTATWSPTLCKNKEVTITASADGLESKTLTFNLSVTKAVGDIIVKYGDVEVSAGDEISVPVGTLFTIHSDDATNINIPSVGDNALSADGPDATWQPNICDKSTITIIAYDNTGLLTQKEFTFNLTVYDPSQLSATWIITGVNGTSNGNAACDLPLTLGEGSAAGNWQAVHSTAYATTTSGHAQFGSNKYPFDGGTLTLTDSDIPANARILSVSMTGYNSTTTHTTWAVTVNGKEATEKIVFGNNNFDEHEVSLANENLIGNQIVLTCGGGSGINQTYLSGITIKYTLEEITLGEVTATVNGDELTSPLVLEEGETVTFSAANATSFEITVGDQDPIELTALDGVAEWTPDACTAQTVSIIAKRVVEGEETQTSEPLTFTLTVNKKIIIIDDIVATYLTNNVINDGDTIIVDENTTLTFKAVNATKIEIAGTDTYADDDELIWTPDVCEPMNITVVASREGSESKTLTFNLTVKKSTQFTATWNVIGVDGQSNGGQKCNLPLLLSEDSADGIWTAEHETAYATTNSGCAQLGSGTQANTFDGGTLTLTGSAIPPYATILSVSMTGYCKNSNPHAVWTVTVNNTDADETIAFNTGSADHTANVNIIGNKIVLTCHSSSTSNMAQVHLSGISITYSLPEETPEPAGDIICEHPVHFQLEEYTTDNMISVMAGTKLTFISENADHIYISSDADGLTLPEAVDGDTIEWDAPDMEEGFYDEITVTAIRDNNTDPVVKVYELYVENVTHSLPTYVPDEENMAITLTCESGALAYMIVEVPTIDEGDIEDPFGAPRRVELTDTWTHPEGVYPKTHTIDYSDLDKDVMVYAKSVVPAGESEPISFMVNGDGIVSGIANVSLDNDNRGEAIYYDLQGRRTDAARPGLYIRTVGGKAEKVVIR